MSASNQQPSESLQPKIKVCGLTQLHQIAELISMNIDFLGFIFYKKSPRYVLHHLSLHDISIIDHQGKVGVFVNENVNTVIETAEKAKLDFIQLHGDESEEYVSELKEKLSPEKGIIKVIRIGSQSSEELQKIINKQSGTAAYLLFDTDSQAFGGTGKTFNWTILNEVTIPLPYFLSGGISPENKEQTRLLDQPPFALDINSKFEVEPGIKDVSEIKKIIVYP